MRGSKRHGQGKGPRDTRQGTVNVDAFLRDTAAAIEKLEAALLRVRKRKRGLETSMSELAERWRSEVSAAKDFLLPDLSIRTIARLKVAVPGFLTADMERTLATARNPKVPFWTWVFGGSKALKQRTLRETHEWLGARLDSHLEGLTDKPDAFAEAAATAARYNEKKDALAEATLHEESLQKQLEGLRHAQASFSRGDREVPKEVADAVSKMSRQSPSNASAQTSTGTDFDYVRDVLIPDIIWERYFDRRGGYYYDRDYRSPGRETYEPTYRREDRDDRPSREGGNASTRMDDAAPSRDGNASNRMSDAAPAQTGNASTRMSDMTRGAVIGAAAGSATRNDPVIAEPFSHSERSGSEGNASMRMGQQDSSFADRPETGRGTSY